MSIKRPRSRGRESGLTIIELIMFIMIVGIAVAGVLAVLNLTTSRSVDPQLRKQALAIAEALLEEVELARFTYCDPLLDPLAEDILQMTAPGLCTTPENVGQETGGIPRPFDNVNDYVTAFSTPVAYTTDAAGQALPTGYTATVTITPDAGLGPAGNQITPVDGTPANMEVLRITVIVTFGSPSQSLALDGYRTRYGPNAGL